MAGILFRDQMRVAAQQCKRTGPSTNRGPFRSFVLHRSSGSSLSLLHQSCELLLKHCFEHSRCW